MRKMNPDGLSMILMMNLKSDYSSLRFGFTWSYSYSSTSLIFQGFLFKQIPVSNILQQGHLLDGDLV